MFILFYYVFRRIEWVNNWYVDVLNKYAIFLLEVSKYIVNLFGYEAVTYGKTLRIIEHVSTRGIFLDRGCMGRNVMLGFMGLIIVYPGKISHKLWYIPMGLGILILVNVARISALAIIADCCPKYSDINHHFVFKIVAWAVIFALWAVWINKFGTIKLKTNRHRDTKK